jgi:hypothetical protein
LGIDSSNGITGAGQQGLRNGESPVSARVKFFSYMAQEILLVDFSRANVQMMKAVAEECRRVVAARPYSSVRTLVDVEGATFDKEVIQVVGDLAKQNRPYVVRSAVLGVTGLRQIAFNAVATLAQREMRLFNVREEALGWLIGQE